jgi:isopenicillin-N N-acyltransferase-like protein
MVDETTRLGAQKRFDWMHCTKHRVIFIGGAVVALLSARLEACTLWGAAGDPSSGGTIVAKNRDWKPDHQQVLRWIRPEAGFAYFGIFTVYEGKSTEGLVAGINEKGLTVFTAATNIPRDKWGKNPGKLSFACEFLSRYPSCDDILANQDEIFPALRPTFIMIADRHKILMVEVGIGGAYALKVVKNDVVAHANHYLEHPLANMNPPISDSSRCRFERINELLNGTPKPYGTASFVTISKDQHRGPDNSLWRTGKTARTLASWIVETPAQGPPSVRVVLINPGREEATYRFVLDATFWQKASRNQTSD